MPATRDYYEVLGVPREASADQIKKAFRSKAREYHPDTSEHTDAEERFKELNEAYEVLSDPEKRATFDQYGTADPRMGFPGGGGGVYDPFGGVGDLFSVFFDNMPGSAGGRVKTRTDGRDMRAQISITLQEAASGTTKEVRYGRLGGCETCAGTGAAPGGSLKTCPVCQGTGQVVSERRTFLGTFQSVQPCMNCETIGTIADPPCPTCAGQGRHETRETVTVEIPAGVLDGQQINVPGKGEAGLRGARTGDLGVSVRVQAHDFLHRDGDDLHAQATVPMWVATLGGEIEVPGLFGPVQAKVPAGVQNQETVVVRGDGMPRQRGGHGDLVLHVNISVPRKLSKQQRVLLTDFAESMGQKKSQSTLERVRDWLGG